MRIGYAAIGSAAGKATIGATKNAYVHLSTRYRNADAVNAQTRVTVMNVFAHELGHVLGFQHTSARCSLMAATLDVGGCNLVPVSQPGHYKCRTIDTRLEQRFIAMYGGRARYPSATWCVIDPLPPTLGVTFTDGLTAPVALHWTRPSSVPSGSSIVVKRWEATTCGTAPSSAAAFHPALATGLWQDQATTQAEDACFQIQLVNRYGAGRAAQARLLSRWVTPLDEPTIGVLSYDFDAEGVHLHRHSPRTALPSPARPLGTATTPAPVSPRPEAGTNAAFVDVIDGQGTLASPAALPQCVSFFAHDPQTGRDSAPVFVTLSDQAVPAPTVGEATWDQETHTFQASASAAAGTHLVYAEADDPSTCPGALVGDPGDLEEPADLGNGVFGFPTLNPDQCVSFYAVANSTAHVSEPTSITATTPLPTETLAATTRLEPYGYPWWYARVTNLEAGNYVGYVSLPGACPSTVPSVTRWRYQTLGDSNPSEPEVSRGDVLFPSQAAGTNCVLFTSLDWWGYQGSRGSGPYTNLDRHRPVTIEEFVDDGPTPPDIGEPVWNAGTGKFQVPVEASLTLHVIYDPDDPTTCPEVGAAGAQEVQVSRLPGQDAFLTPPATPDSCVTFYTEANEGPVRKSQGVPVELHVPEG